MSAARSRAVSRVLAAVGGVLSTVTLSTVSRTALTIAIESVAEALNPAQLAQRCHRSPRSLSRDLRASGLPPPAALIAWAKLLVALALLDDRDVSVEHAALEIGLSDSAAFVHLCRRHVGWTPGRLREEGGLLSAIRILAERITTKQTEPRC
jgi:AraC-like DNA-binding protein